MEIRKLFALVSRNMKCYFKDKFLFLVSLITPMILLLLFVTFLRGVYISSFNSIFDQFNFTVDDDIINGLAGSWLLSSIVSVSSVTVAICSNAVMIQDKIDGSLNDLSVSPVKGTTVSISYFVANFLVTLLVMLCVLAVGSVYLAVVGWYIPFGDFMMIFVDIVCAVLFGTLLAGVIESFISAGRTVRNIHACVQYVRIYLRRIYAVVAVCRRYAQRHLCSSRHLQCWNDAQTLYGRICREISRAGTSRCRTKSASRRF